MGLMEFIVMFPTAYIMNKTWCNRSRVIAAMWVSLGLALFGCALCLHLSTEEGDLAR